MSPVEDRPTLADLGIEGPSSTVHAGPILGEIRNPLRLEWYEYGFFILAVVDVLAVIGFAIYRLVDPLDKDDDLIFAAVIIGNAATCLLYSFHGVLKMNASQMFVLAISAVTIGLYIIANFSTFQAQGKCATEPEHCSVKIARLVCVVALGLPLIGIALWLMKKYYSNPLLVQLIVGSVDESTQRMCRRLLLFQSFLLFDSQAQVSSLFLGLPKGFQVFGTEEIITFSISLPYVIGFLALGYFGMAKEKIVCFALFIVLAPVALVYVGYRFIILTTSYDSADLIFVALVVCYLLTFLIRISVIIISGLVFVNFGKGLKEKFGAGSSNGIDQNSYSHLDSPPMRM